jgi:hypothetical protein
VDQYGGLGLRFPVQPGALPEMELSTAVVRLAGVDAWAPATLTEAVAGRVASVDYGHSITGQLSRSTGSLSVEVVGIAGETLMAFNGHGQMVGSAGLSGQPGPHGGRLLTVQGADITSFTVTEPLLPLADAIVLPFPFPPPQPWGVAEVDFTSAPEPASLALAALGLGLGLCFGVGRARRARPITG